MTPAPRGLWVGLGWALVLSWAPYVALPGSGLAAPVAQSIVFGALAVLTVCSRRAKVAVVRTAQRFVINPVVRALLAVGLNPLGLVLLETRGRATGLPRRTPVGDGRVGNTVWIVAEHGERAGYVRNLRRDPRVRVRVREGLRYRWRTGHATVLPEDDALARQRRLVRWHPLRALNAVTVRVLGTDLLTVRVDLVPRTAATSDPPALVSVR